MNLNQLQNFITIANCQNITRASEILSIAQPSLSVQIHSLEEHMGAPLFFRNKRSLELTEAGKSFYDMAQAILRLEDNTKTDISNIVRGTSGILKIGITASRPDSLIKESLKQFALLYPNVKYMIYERDSQELLNALKNGDIELALVRYAYELLPPLKKVLSLPEKPYAYWSKTNSQLSPYKSDILISDLADIPLCLTFGHEDYLKNMFAEKGLSPHIKCSCSSRNMALQMADITNSVAILTCPDSEILVDSNFYNCPIAVANLIPPRNWVINTEKRLSINASNFLNLLTENS